MACFLLNLNQMNDERHLEDRSTLNYNLFRSWIRCKVRCDLGGHLEAIVASEPCHKTQYTNFWHYYEWCNFKYLSQLWPLRPYVTSDAIWRPLMEYVVLNNIKAACLTHSSDMTLEAFLDCYGLNNSKAIYQKVQCDWSAIHATEYI